MKNTRKLIPAIAMLLVSAVMMSTASFAWFSTANQATATGMVVKASAAGGIAIATYTNTGDAPDALAFLSTVNLGAGTSWKNAAGTSLKPASFDGTKWYYAEAQDVDSNAAKTGTYQTVHTFNAADTITGDSTGYYLHSKVQLKALATDTAAHRPLYINEISVSFADSSTTDALNKALRVAVYCDGQWTYFAPTRTSTTGLVHTTSSGDPATYDTDDYANMTFGGTPNNSTGVTGYKYTSTTGVAISTNNLTNTAMDVDIYIYFEGEDPNCKTAYAVSLNDTTINFSFTSK